MQGYLFLRLICIHVLISIARPCTVVGEQNSVNDVHHTVRGNNVSDNDLRSVDEEFVSRGAFHVEQVVLNRPHLARRVDDAGAEGDGYEMSGQNP